MSAKQKIIMGMGNAVLDVLIPCDDHEIMQVSENYDCSRKR